MTDDEKDELKHDAPYPGPDDGLERLTRRIKIAQGYSELWFIFLTAISPVVAGWIALQVLNDPELASDPAWAAPAGVIITALVGLLLRDRRRKAKDDD